MPPCCSRPSWRLLGEERRRVGEVPRVLVHPCPPGYSPVIIDVCDGSVCGTAQYAARNRIPCGTSALNDGVSTFFASGPIASARVVSSVTSRIDGRSAEGETTCSCLQAIRKRQLETSMRRNDMRQRV